MSIDSNPYLGSEPTKNSEEQGRFKAEMAWLGGLILSFGVPILESLSGSKAETAFYPPVAYKSTTKSWGLSG